MAQHQRLQLPKSDEHSHFNGHLTVAFKEKKTLLLQQNAASSKGDMQPAFFLASLSCLLVPSGLLLCSNTLFLPPPSHRPTQK